MGIITTEGFSRFATGLFTNPSGTTGRPIQADSEWTERAFYSGVQYTVNGAIDTSTTRTNVGLVQDPIIASKKRLALDCPNPVDTKNVNVGYSMQRTFAAAKTKYQLGFLVRFREGDYFKNNTTATADKSYGMEVTPAGAALSTVSGSTQFRYATVGTANTSGVSSQSIFGMSNVGSASSWGALTTASSGHANPPDFRMQGVRDPNASGMTLAYDTDVFCEIEIDTVNKTIKCWIDDVYVGASTWNATYHPALANGFAINVFRGGAGHTTNDVGGIMVSDIYVLDLADGVSPNTRLGKTTRVLGEMPDADVTTGFSRPDGFAGNYDVVNDPIATNATPSSYLSGEGAGTEDVYQNTNSSIATFAGTVYGVVIRNRFQNASSTAHEVAATADDGTTKVSVSLGQAGAGAAAMMKSAVLNKDPSGKAWTPATAATFKYGFKIIS